MQHADAGAHFGRMETALPVRGGVAPVSALKCQQIDAIARPQPRGIVEDRDEFGIKADVYALGVIKELEVSQQRHVGEDVLDEQGFTPAAVADNQVGPKTLLA